VFGTGELFKIIMVYLAVVFLITRDIYRSAEDIAQERVTKSLSLGASEFATVFRLMAPQLMPRLLSSVRLALIAGWTMIILTEAIASQEGLGYRIFLVRRYLDMKTIIPYVLIIATLAFLLDRLLVLWIKKGYPWFNYDNG